MGRAQKLTGKVPRAAVHLDVARVPPEVVRRFDTIDDLAGTVSDVLDELGIIGAVGASVLRPTIPGARLVGTAITVLDRPVRQQPYLYTEARTSLLGEIEAHNQAQTGDVLVVQGVPGVSSLGGLSAAVGQRQGEIGAIVDGGVRDVGWQRQIAYPVWSLDVTPVTGKWRIQTLEVNGPVTIQGVEVHAGDLVVADDTGVCFVPAAIIARVLLRCEEIVSGESVRHDDIRNGLTVPELATKKYAYKQGRTPR